MRNFVSIFRNLWMVIFVLFFAPQIQAQEVFAGQAPLVEHKPAIHEKEWLFTGCVTIPQGSVGLLENMGEYIETLQAGFHWRAPLVHSYSLVDMRSIFMDAPQHHALTNNMQSMMIDGSFTYRITNPYQALYNVQDLEDSLIAMYYQSIVAHIAQLSDTEVIGLNKSTFSKDIMDHLNETICGEGAWADGKGKGKKKQKQKTKELENPTESASLSYQKAGGYGTLSQEPKKEEIDNRQWGVHVEKVTITNIAYPKNILQNMAAKRDAEYQKQILEIQATASQQKMKIDAAAAQTKVQIDSDARVYSVQREAEAQAIKRQIEIDNKLQTAEADAKARIIQAKSVAEAAVIEAEAQAKAKSLVAKVYEDNPEYAKYLRSQIVADSMVKFHTSNNSKVIFGAPTDSNNFMTQLLATQEILEKK